MAAVLSLDLRLPAAECNFADAPVKDGASDTPFSASLHKPVGIQDQRHRSVAENRGARDDLYMRRGPRLRGLLPRVRHLVRGARLPERAGHHGAVHRHRRAQAHRSSSATGCSPASTRPSKPGSPPSAARATSSRPRACCSKRRRRRPRGPTSTRCWARSATFCCARSTTSVSCSSSWDADAREVEIAVSRGSAAAPRERFAFDRISDGAKRAIATQDHGRDRLRPDRTARATEAVRRRTRFLAHARRAHGLPRTPCRTHHRRSARGAPGVQRP